MINWIEKRFLDSRQRVVIDGELFKLEVSFEWGMLILGPILFLICINDLYDAIMRKVLTFEDDTKVIQIDSMVRKWKMLFNFLEV